MTSGAPIDAGAKLIRPISANVDGPGEKSDESEHPGGGRPEALRSAPHDLYQLRPARWLRDFAIDWAIILATFGAVSAIGSIWVFPIAALIIGARLHALGLLAHDATHRIAFRNRGLNDTIAEVFITWPLFVVIDHGYRPWHFDHHRSLGTDHDPELSYRAFDPYIGAPTWKKVALYFVSDLFGFGLIDLVKFLAILFPRTRPIRIAGPLVLWGTFFAIALWAGKTWVFWLWAWSVFGGYWAVFRVRTWSEHVGVMANGKETSHRFAPGPLARFLFFPHNTFCHYEHHKWPQIPYYNLVKLRALDRSKPVIPFPKLFSTRPLAAVDGR